MKRFLLALLLTPAYLVCSNDPKSDWSPTNPHYPLNNPMYTELSGPPVYKDGPPVYGPPVYKYKNLAEIAFVAQETGTKPSEWRVEPAVEEMVRVGCMEVPARLLVK
jgi:hypothetical protein